MAKKNEKKNESEIDGFDFLDIDTVIVKGIEDKRFSTSPKKEYTVTGKMAKILLKKGAVELVSIKTK